MREEGEEEIPILPFERATCANHQLHRAVIKSLGGANEPIHILFEKGKKIVAKY